MGTKIKISCDGCGVTGSIEMDMNIDSLDVGGQVNISQPCPQCGGNFSAPGGRYEKTPDGVLERVGDYTPSP